MSRGYKEPRFSRGAHSLKKIFFSRAKWDVEDIICVPSICKARREESHLMIHGTGIS